jgi:hypothetical protein
MKTLFIVPNNDAEALKIQEILKREGKKRVKISLLPTSSGARLGINWKTK